MSLPLAAPLLCGRRSLVGCAGAEPPQLVPLGMHGSFVRASDVGSGRPASGSHPCKGTVSPGCQRSHLAVEKGAPGFPGHPCHQLQLPARGTIPGAVSLPSRPLCSCRRRVSMHAASQGTQCYQCQLPARQGEAAAAPAGNLESLPDLSPMSCL